MGRPCPCPPPGSALPARRTLPDPCRLRRQPRGVVALFLAGSLSARQASQLRRTRIFREGGKRSVSTQPGQQADFGANEWLVYEIHQQFLKDPSSVSAEWREFLSDYSPGDPSSEAGESTPAPNGAANGAPNGSAAAPAAPAAVTPAAPAAAAPAAP